MFDCAKDVRAYHDQDVTLPKTEQDAMRDRRNANRTRLRNGLAEAGKPAPLEFVKQGSYAMKTMVRDPDNDYDIDDGVYFRKEDLVGDRGAEMTSLQARQMVRDAVDDGKFKTPPEVRTNCVRVFYEKGYHVDLPVYRRVVTTTVFGDEIHYELAASSGWKRSDARDVTDWYEDERAKSADGVQLRRITRELKKYARSRYSWRGEILERLRHHRARDRALSRHDGREDRALYDTMVAIRDRLNWDLQVAHPVTPGDYITSGPTMPGALLPRQADRGDRHAAAALRGRLHARAGAEVLGQGVRHDLLQRAARGGAARRGSRAGDHRLGGAAGFDGGRGAAVSSAGGGRHA